VPPELPLPPPLLLLLLPPSAVAELPRHAGRVGAKSAGMVTESAVPKDATRRQVFLFTAFSSIEFR
jgi:hypothetical protein